MSSSAPIGPKTISPPLRLKGLLQGGLLELQVHLAKFNRQSPPETIHRIRVLSRRQRALCRLLQFSGAPEDFRRLEKRLKTLTKALSPIRNRDVSLERLKGQEKKFKEQAGGGGLKFLRKAFRKRLKNTRRECLAKVPKRKILKILGSENTLQHWGWLSEEILERQLEKRLAAASEQVLKQWRQFRESGRTEDLHQVRIGWKNYRYTLEIHSSCFGIPDKETLEQFKFFQDRMGFIQDLGVLKGHLVEKSIRKKVPGKKRKRMGRFKNYLNRALKEAVREFPKTHGVRFEDLVRGGIS